MLGAGYASAMSVYGFWNGMMGNGMMGGMGCGVAYVPHGYENISIQEAKQRVEQYIAGNANLKLSEIMEFENHFYAQVEEKNTNMHAFELIINKYTGRVSPEMGPNMMWNTKYGHMSLGISEAKISKEQALEYAQAYLDKALPGTKAEDAHVFYGYYTIHVLKDGNIDGMLSVNSNTGEVWYHTWHGKFIRMIEEE